MQLGVDAQLREGRRTLRRLYPYNYRQCRRITSLHWSPVRMGSPGFVLYIRLKHGGRLPWADLIHTLS